MELNSRWGFALLALSLHLDSVPLLLLGHLTLLPALACFLFVCEFSEELLVHPSRSPATFRVEWIISVGRDLQRSSGPTAWAIQGRSKVQAWC